RSWSRCSSAARPTSGQSSPLFPPTATVCHRDRHFRQVVGRRATSLSEGVHLLDNERAPISPLPLLRSRRQCEILSVVLVDPEVEFGLSTLAAQLSIPYSSVHREVRRAERSGVVTTRRVENRRFVRADVASPYYMSLTTLLCGYPTRSIGE